MEGSSGCAESVEVSQNQKRSHLQGGHECVFVEEPPKHLQTECSVCLSILKEPHLIDCDCGSSFCRTCIQPIKSEGKPCPLCNGPFTTAIPNRRLNRTLNSLQVYCSYKTSGCEWVGELGTLTQHISLDITGSACAPSNSVQADDNICHFVPIDCPHCRETFGRRFIEVHKTKLCPKRPFCCEICNNYKSTFEEVTTSHKPVCPSRLVPCSNKCGATTEFKGLSKHLAKDCPLEVINCSFSFTGCGTRLPRKDLPAHISADLTAHLSLQTVDHQKMLEKLEARVLDLEDEIKKLKSHVQIAPVQLVLDKYASKRESGDTWDSRPFYTHLQGYKMCLNVDVNGYGIGEGTHISVFFVIMRGEFDHQLKWPFHGSLNITLLDQEGDQHWSVDISYNEETPQRNSGQVIDEDENEGWGTYTFIAHKDLHPKYFKISDSLIFKVSC